VTLSLQGRRVGDITIFKCSGRIVDGAESVSLQQQVGHLLPDDPFIILDLSDVDFIDSSGLGLLVRLLNRTHAVRGDIKLCAVPPRIVEILRITRLRTIFNAHDTEADAIAAFYKRGESAENEDRLATDILCVASSVDVLAYLSELLRQAGYGVMTSANLPDALVLLRATQPRLVVIAADLRSMPAADTFNEIADMSPVVELSADFSLRDAGEAGRRLLDRVSRVLASA
jgi:anti-sigma B factor antagonist